VAKRIHFAAISSALATTVAVVAFLPSAYANSRYLTAEQIMAKCNKAAKVNGVQRRIEYWMTDSFAADSCDFSETKFETFNGPPQKSSIDFPNCEPGEKKPTKVRVTSAAQITQGEGRYEFTQQGAGGGLFGALSGSWLKHEGTLDLTLHTVTATETEEREVPPGKVLHMEFIPKMQRMTGIWKVFTAARRQSTVIPASPEERYEAEDSVQGPYVRPGAAGAPGIPDGVSKPVFTNC
jgi:hypothetical protein